MKKAHVLLLVLLGSASVSADETRVASKDSFLTQGSANTNEGANPILRLQQSGKNRAVVGFDLSGIPLAGLQQATLTLTISDNSNNWGTAGRPVRVHRLVETFTEGNGWNVGGNIRGTGSGVTWNCAVDGDIEDQSADCAVEWDGGSFSVATAPAVLIANGLTGEISFDVTADVAGLGAGALEALFVVKKEDEGQAGQVEFFSREAAASAGNPSLAPRLVLVTASANEPPVAGNDEALTAIGGSFASGVTLRDSIKSVSMVSGNTPGTLEMDHRIVAVTDEVDDSRDSKGNNFSGKADGKDDDPTILVRPGSDLRVTYRGDGRERRSSAVGVCLEKRKVNLHLVNSTDPNADPAHKWEIAEIDRVVKDASGIWAQLCVDLAVINHNGSTVVQAPSANIPLGPIASTNSQGYDRAGNPITGTGIVSVGVELTPSAKQVIDALRLSPGGSPNVGHDDVRVYFVDQLTAGGATISGIAVTQSHYFKQVQNIPALQLDPESSEYGGAVLLAKDAGEVVLGGSRTRFSANGKTFAHEIAHLVFDQAKAQPPDPSATPPVGVPGFSGPPVNILNDQSEFDVESLLKKRFDSGQRARRSKFLKSW